MDYHQTLDWLFGLESMGIKLGLANITELLHRLGDPQDSFRSVHVAGTNGKGSVSAMLASILLAQGCRTGLYTSPHVVDFRERIKVDGVDIPQQRLCELAEEVRGHVEDMRLVSAEGHPTFFEVTTAIAFLYFAELGVEEAVVEVGMGGRLDATNVIRPDCTVITRIALEHTRYLGDTLGRIAAEKAGIIKPGVPVVTTEAQGEAFDTISQAAAARGAPLVVVRPGEDYLLTGSGLEGIRVKLPGIDRQARIPLLGGYQASNAGMAYAVVKQLRGQGLEVSEHAVLGGLRTVEWPGRLEVVGRDPFVIMDATHTPQGAEVVAKDLASLVKGSIILVLGVLDDKDLDGIVRPFASISDKAIATAPGTSRAIPAPRIQEALCRVMEDVKVCPSVVGALRMALQEVRPKDTILVTGSIYTIGEAKAWWGTDERRALHP